MLAFGHFRATSLHGLGWQDLGTDGGVKGAAEGCRLPRRWRGLSHQGGMG